jgi:hypothetical protein
MTEHTSKRFSVEGEECTYDEFVASLAQEPAADSIYETSLLQWLRKAAVGDAFEAYNTPDIRRVA